MRLATSGGAVMALKKHDEMVKLKDPPEMVCGGPVAEVDSLGSLDGVDGWRSMGELRRFVPKEDKGRPAVGRLQLLWHRVVRYDPAVCALTPEYEWRDIPLVIEDDG